MSELEDHVAALVRSIVREELARREPAWEWATVEQAAELLGCGRKGIYSKIERGALRGHRFDGRVYVSRRELEAAIRADGS